MAKCSKKSMKRIEISYTERLEHPHNIEWWEYVRARWIKAGFDMNKPVTQSISVDTDHIVFTQED